MAVAVQVRIPAVEANRVTRQEATEVGREVAGAVVEQAGFRVELAARLDLGAR